MSHFSDGQLRQVGNSLEMADWTPEDLTLFGQAGRDRLVGIRDGLRRGRDILGVIERGQMELWLAPGQVESCVQGYVVYDHLQKTGLLAGCADFAELEAIQAKGVVFFRKYFRGKAVFGWRDLEDSCVPYLVEFNNEVVLDWYHLDFYFSTISLALRRK